MEKIRRVLPGGKRIRMPEIDAAQYCEQALTLFERFKSCYNSAGDSLAVSSCCSIWVTNTVVSFFPLWIHVNYYFLLGLTISMSCIDTFN